VVEKFFLLLTNAAGVKDFNDDSVFFLLNNFQLVLLEVGDIFDNSLAILLRQITLIQQVNLISCIFAILVISISLICMIPSYLQFRYKLERLLDTIAKQTGKPVLFRTGGRDPDRAAGLLQQPDPEAHRGLPRPELQVPRVAAQGQEPHPQTVLF
jgi:hypothetical protein